MRWTGLFLGIVAVGIAFGLPGRRSDAVVAGATGLALCGSSFVWPRCAPSGKWLRRLGLAAFLALVLQGVLGGLRVVLFKDYLGIFHATLAQLFFVLLCAIALFTSRWWQESGSRVEGRGSVAEMSPSTLDNRPSTLVMRRPQLLFLGATLLVLLQLILGAAMRHQHAGLAIPDFPLAYGHVWPAMDPASVALYNQQRLEITTANPITAFQIALQMAHRIVAVVILGAVAVCAGQTRRKLGSRHLLSKLALAWLGLILAQVVLGAATIWSNKAADIATLHVMVGALSLGTGALLSIILFRAQFAVPATVPAVLPSALALRPSPFGTRHPALGPRP